MNTSNESQLNSRTIMQESINRKSINTQIEETLANPLSGS